MHSYNLRLAENFKINLKTSLKIHEPIQKKYIFNQYLYTMIQNSADSQKF